MKPIILARTNDKLQTVDLSKQDKVDNYTGKNKRISLLSHYLKPNHHKCYVIVQELYVDFYQKTLYFYSVEVVGPARERFKMSPTNRPKKPTITAKMKEKPPPAFGFLRLLSIS